MVKFVLFTVICLNEYCVNLSHDFQSSKDCQAEAAILLKTIIENDGKNFFISCKEKKFL
jgi:hypothetical protein